MSLPDITPPTADRLATRLHAGASQIRKQLQTLLELPIDEHKDSEPLAEQLYETLKTFWTGTPPSGVPRYKALVELFRQCLYDEVALKIEDGRLTAAYQHYVPPPRGLQDATLECHVLCLSADDERREEVHGALVFTRDQGPCLLYLPGLGIDSFPSLVALRTTLAGWLDDQALCSLLLRNTSLEYQHSLAQLQADPELSAPAWTDKDMSLLPLGSDPFTHTIKRQLVKQAADVAWACRQQALREQDASAWRLGIQAALDLTDLIGPQAMLRRRDSERQQRETRLQAPEWLRNASREERGYWIDSLIACDQARLQLHDMMQGCASARQYASSRLTLHVHNDLGYDLDPDQVLVTTRRHDPVGHEPYEQQRSLSELALYGLHEGDLADDSDFLTGTVFSLAGQSLAQACPKLTPRWAADTVTRLDLRIGFGEAQRQVMGNAQVKAMMSTVIGHELVAQAYAALYKAQIRPGDFVITAPLLEGKEAAVASVQHLRLNDELMGKLLLFRIPRSDTGQERLVLFCHDLPDKEALHGFDNERQLLHELVSWTSSATLRQYLLDQVPGARRPALELVLLELGQKSLLPPGLLGFTDSINLDDALHAMTTAHIRVKIDEQRQHTPDWLLRASAAQRGELLALEEAIAGLSARYQAMPHARAPDFEQFVQQMASRKINALLGLPDGTVDPDRIIITSPRETLSYTLMLRNGYDDSLGFLNAAADTQATFSGPDGVDLSALTPENVAGSVRGAWPSDAWIAQVRATLLASDNEGYEQRRRLSLLLTQLQMRSAALRSLLTGQLNAGQYAWLRLSIDTMQRSDTQSRQDFPVYPLRFQLDNPLIGSEVPALGEIIKHVTQTALGENIPVYRLETAQGCHVLCPAQDPDQALIYTPDAPDGLAYRPLRLFMKSLHNPGMSDYYKDRCHRAMNRTLAFYFIDLKKRSDAEPPALPARPYEDLHEVCYDRVLQRKLRDVEDATEGRSDMLAKVVMNGIELVAIAMTLPFPPASFTVGAAMAIRDSALALSALNEGDQITASLHVLGTWLNALGAAGDATAGLKGFGGVLRHLADRGGQNPALAAIKQTRSALAPLDTQAAQAFNGHTRLTRATPHDPQKLLASGHFTEQEVANLVRPIGTQPPAPVPVTAPPPAPAHAVRQSLADTTPIESGHAKGVTLIDGHYYIELDSLVYEVQFDARLRLWQIIDPANPFAFYGKQPVLLGDSGRWQLLEPDRLRGGGGGTPFSRLDNSPVSPGPSSTSPSINSAYELPEKWQPHAMAVADQKWVPVDDYGLNLPAEFFAQQFSEGRVLYRQLRDALRRDAVSFFDSAPLAAKADLPTLDPDITCDALFKTVFEHSNGLVIGEDLQAIASKRLLIENMPRLAEQNVEILYLEPLFTDAHVRKLQKYLKRGGKRLAGSAELRVHLDSLNHGALFNATPDKHDYYHVIKAAHRHGIEVKPFSSSVSYDFLHSSAGVEDATTMQKMSVFFGSRLIAADIAQAPSRRWVALLDQHHANTHGQVPGIAELHGAISLRTRDVPGDKPVRIVRDLGEAQDGSSRGDFLLEMPSPWVRPASSQPAVPPSGAAAEPGKLDLALQGLLNRQPAQGAAAPVPGRQLLDEPGQHGFSLDPVGRWQRADAATWPASQEPTALQRSLADPLYLMPAEHLDMTHELALFQKRGLNMLYSSENPTLEPARELFFKLRARLHQDAQALTGQPLPARPTLPILPPLGNQVSQADLLDELYAHARGLVIGEANSAIASKKFIIDNLPQLSKNHVKTLYVEHLQFDMHQLDLDLFNEKGLMSKRLLHYLKHLDHISFCDPAHVHNFEQLVIKAREYGIEVQSLDCMASYYVANMPSPSRFDRMKMMNFFASRRIRRHQEVMGQHKWVALVSEAHASTFEKSVPGLAELEQGISLRVFDMPHGTHFGPAVDPGRSLDSVAGLPRDFVRNDYALGLPSHHGRIILEGPEAGSSRMPFSPAALESRLYLPGRFTLEGMDTHSPVIVHRSRANRIERTPILKNGKGRFYVDRESWTGVHLRPFEKLSELLQALRRMNMTLVI